MDLDSKIYNEKIELGKYIRHLEAKQLEMEVFIREIAKYLQDTTALLNIISGMLVSKEILSDTEIRSVLTDKLKEMRETTEKRGLELQNEFKIKQLFDGYCAQCSSLGAT